MLHRHQSPHPHPGPHQLLPPCHMNPCAGCEASWWGAWVHHYPAGLSASSVKKNVLLDCSILVYRIISYYIVLYRIISYYIVLYRIISYLFKLGWLLFLFFFFRCLIIFGCIALLLLSLLLLVDLPLCCCWGFDLFIFFARDQLFLFVSLFFLLNKNHVIHVHV